MSAIAVAVIALSILSTLHMVISLAIVGRLRRHTEALNELSQARDDRTTLPVGASVDEFSTTTSDGEEISSRSLGVTTLVGFFTPGCSACAEQLPRFIEDAPKLIQSSNDVIAVVAADDAESDSVLSYATRLRSIAKVVVEGFDGPLSSSFAIRGHPTFALVDSDMTVLAMSHDLDGVRAPAGAHG